MCCQNLNSLTGCGNCKIFLTDKDDISLLNTRSIYYLISNLFDKILIQKDIIHQTIDIESSYITCNGLINIVYTLSSTNRSKQQIKLIISVIIYIWINNNENYIFESYISIYLCMVLYILIDKDNESIADTIIDMKNVMNNMFNFENILSTDN